MHVTQDDQAVDPPKNTTASNRDICRPIRLPADTRACARRQSDVGYVKLSERLVGPLDEYSPGTAALTADTDTTACRQICTGVGIGIAMDCDSSAAATTGSAACHAGPTDRRDRTAARQRANCQIDAPTGTASTTIVVTARTWSTIRRDLTIHRKRTVNV